MKRPIEALEKTIYYFAKSGLENTDKTIQLARERAEELGIRDIVVASTHGGTAIKVADAFKDMDANIVAVTICAGFTEEGWIMSDERCEELKARGLSVLTCPHTLGDTVGSAFTEKFGGKTPSEMVAQTLYRFCQGMKVAVEVTLMAADAGLIGVDREVIAIAGTDKGADTCIVVKPSYSRKFLELEIREIVAKPRIP